MNKINNIWTKIRRKWMKLRLQPIRVYCIHHVSAEYDPQTMWECDWIQLDEFKWKIMQMKSKGVRFISLPEAHERLKHDWIRFNKFAVLTADDGFKTILNIAPWLNEQQIPITLFVNPKYILEDSMGDNTKHRLEIKGSKASSRQIYLKPEDIKKLDLSYITFAYHGYEHLDEKKIDETAFSQNVQKCKETMLTYFPNVIPYYAHTFGRTNKGNDEMLLQQGITPIYVSGTMNYNNVQQIDRELLTTKRL